MSGSAAPGAALARPLPDEPTLDQLLAEPIVQQLMRRDGIDEAAIRHLLQKTAAAQPVVRLKDDLNADDPHWLLHETARLAEDRQR